MYPLNDKDLDRLSRDAAEHYDVESSTSGWERLENRLDKELPVKKDRRRFLFWLTFVALLTGGSLVYMLGRTPAESNLASDKQEAGTVGKVPAAKVREAEKKADENAINSQQEKGEHAKGSTPVRGTDNPANAVSAKDKPAAAGAVKDRAAGTDAVKNNPANSSVVKADAAIKTVDKNTATKNTNPPSNKSTVARDQSRKLTTRNNPLTVSNSNDRLRKPLKNKTQKQQADADLPLIKNDEPGSFVVINDPLQSRIPLIDGTKMYQQGVVKKDIPVPGAEVAKKPEVKQNSSKPSKWEFGILTGPDFSNVGFEHNYKTGFNLGLTVGYRISNRLQVNTGLIYTKKYYKVDGEDFYPPKHSWISYQDVIDVKGSCNMFEIPINLRYDFAYNQKSRWFASTGLSSYIMNKQDYDCRYINNMGVESNWAKTEDSTYKYLFSNLNFSIGYERAIGRNFSIQAEPYFRLPMKGLGYGSIDMNSYGLFVTFKYKPSVRRPKK